MGRAHPVPDCQARFTGLALSRNDDVLGPCNFNEQVDAVDSERTKRLMSWRNWHPRAGAVTTGVSCALSFAVTSISTAFGSTEQKGTEQKGTGQIKRR